MTPESVGSARRIRGFTDRRRRLATSPLRNYQQVPVADYFRDDAPARTLVQIDPNPTARPNVRWTEEPFGILVKQQVLIDVRRFDPDTRPSATVMVVSTGVHREELVSQAKCRRTPRFDLVCFRKSEADRAQLVERVTRFCRRITCALLAALGLSFCRHSEACRRSQSQPI